MTNQAWADILAAELVRLGVAGFVVCPGSRSTPLALAAARQARVRAVSHFDERGAGYLALGWAKAANRPVALVCTSGTAAANFYPAVVEAAMSRVPLVVLTADRPPELLGCGANQTIDQERIFGVYARISVQLPCPCDDYPEAVLCATVDHALSQSMHPTPGPVHLNCMFREPLAPEGELPRMRQMGGMGEEFAPIDATPPKTQWVAPEMVLPDGEKARLLARLQSARRGVVMAGELRTNAERAAALDLAKTLQWPVFPDVLSGLRLGGGAPLAPYYDVLLNTPEFQERFQPDFVLWLGGGFVSKRLMECLPKGTAEVVHVAGHSVNLDHARIVSLRLVADVAPFCHWLANAAALPKLTWDIPFQELQASAAGAIDTWLDKQEHLTEIGVTRAVSHGLGGETALFLGNSMPVRDMEMFGAHTGAPGVVMANRGASGIDGNIATAAGMALGGGKPVVAVLGDVAALHDLNSLALARLIETPMALVVVNNDGGGIFSFLPVARHAGYLAPWFATPHGLGFEDAARMFGLAYAQPDTMESLTAALRGALAKPGLTLVEVRTNRDENVADHRVLHGAIQEAVRGVI